MDFTKQSQEELLRELVKERLQKYESRYGSIAIDEERAATRKSVIILVCMCIAAVLLYVKFPLPMLEIFVLIPIVKRALILSKKAGTVNWIAMEAEQSPDANIDQIIANHYGRRLPEESDAFLADRQWRSVFADISGRTFSYEPVRADDRDDRDDRFETISMSGMRTIHEEYERQPSHLDAFDTFAGNVSREKEDRTSYTMWDAEPYHQTSTKKRKKKGLRVVLTCLAIMVFFDVLMFFNALSGNVLQIQTLSDLIGNLTAKEGSAQAGGKTGEIRYTENGTGYTLVCYGDLSQENVILPDTYEGKPVTQIENGAFKGNEEIRSVVLPNSVIGIGAEAFMDCINLQSVTIPYGVTELRGNTFQGCYSLTEVKLPTYMTAIHGECFKGCRALTSIVLPDGITEVRGSTFEGCSSLQTVVIPEGVTRIGGHAFYECNALWQVQMPTTVREIGSSAFRRCSNLKTIQIPVAATVNERAFKESPTNILYQGE